MAHRADAGVGDSLWASDSLTPMIIEHLRRLTALTCLLPLAAAAQQPSWRSASGADFRRMRSVAPPAVAAPRVPPEVVVPSVGRPPRDDVPLVVHRRCTREEVARLPVDPDQQFGAGPQLPIGILGMPPWVARIELVAMLLRQGCGLAVPERPATPPADDPGHAGATGAVTLSMSSARN